MKNKETIYYVGDQNAPPFSFINKKTGNYQGLALDYASALSLTLGVDVTFVSAGWEDAVESLKSGKSDICDMYPSKQRETYFSFSDPIYWMKAIVAVQSRNTSIHAIADLKGRRIGIPVGDYAVEYAQEHLPEAIIVETPNLSDAIDQLLAGKIDAIIGDEPVLIYLAKDKIADNQIKLLDEPLFSKNVCFALEKSQTQLLEIINKGIFQLKKQNILQNVQQKWFGISTSIEFSKIPQQILILSLLIINVLLFLSVATAFYNKKLKAEVNKRTQELYTSRNTLQLTLDALPAFLISVSAGGIVLNVNEAFAKQTGMEKNYIIGRKYENFPFLSFVCKAFHLKDSPDGYIKNKTLQYERQYFDISILSLPTENQILIAANDITSEVLNHKQMLQDNKMIAVGQLAAGVAHEIRNPLGNIQNYSFILKDQLKETNPIIDKCFSVMEASVKKAGNIINNLLNFSRISGNERQLLHLKDVFDSILSLEYDTLSKNHITVDLEYDKSTAVVINPEALNLILLNLISNSADAMPEGGAISIKCSVKSQALFMEFTDTGKGISPDITEQIFNPFFTTKEAGHGTGLGLYIVYTEVKGMGGQIQVESHPGKGTCFKLEIPVGPVKEVNQNA